MNTASKAQAGTQSGLNEEEEASPIDEMKDKMLESSLIALSGDKNLATLFTEEELDMVVGELDEEMYALQERMKLLRKERQMLDVIYIIMHPSKALGGWRDVTRTLASRLRRTREALERPKKPSCCIEKCSLDVLANGLCYSHYHATKKGQRGNRPIPPPKTEPVEKKPNKKMISKCCLAPTFEGKRHKAGDRYCDECGEACLWTLIQINRPDNFDS